MRRSIFGVSEQQWIDPDCDAPQAEREEIKRLVRVDEAKHWWREHSEDILCENTMFVIASFSNHPMWSECGITLANIDVTPMDGTDGRRSAWHQTSGILHPSTKIARHGETIPMDRGGWVRARDLPEQTVAVSMTLPLCCGQCLRMPRTGASATCPMSTMAV